MLMPHIFPILLVIIHTFQVLNGVMADASDVLRNVSRVRRTPQPHHTHRQTKDEELELTAAWKRNHWRETQAILRKESMQNDVVECCPSVLEMVAKKGGRTPTGLYVELYEDGENKQRLYELSCAPGVVDKPCRFIDFRLYNRSRCVQKYSYTYALVRYTTATEMPEEEERPEGQFSVPGSGGWSMDYIIVRAGCECQITPPKRKAAHRKRMERHRQKKRNKRVEEYEDT